MFAITADDPYFGWDLDDCREPETGWIHPAALALAARFGTYYEVSPSLTGIKGVGIGCKPKPPTEGKKPRCTSKDTPWGGQIEIYDQARFFTITENTVGERGLPIRDAQDVLDSVCLEFIPEPQEPAQAPRGMNTNPTQDGELLKVGRNAKQLGPKFSALYDRGDISWSGNDRSKADNDLMSQLAYLTWKDPARMEALFSESALGQREKWTSRPDYRKRTIDYAIKNTSGRYDPENEKYKPREGSTRTRDKLEEIHHYAVIGYGWEEITGDPRSGARDYAAFVVMLRAAWKANSFEIDMDGRDLMVAAGLGKRATAVKAIASLQNTHRLVVKIKDGSPGKAARYRIKDLTPSIRDHALIGEKFFTSTPPCGYNECGPLLSKSAQIRNTSPTSYEDYDKNGRPLSHGGEAPVSSVGKVAGRVLDLIHDFSRIAGEPAPLEFLEERTGVRRDNLKSRHIRKLIEARLILEVEGGYTTPENIEECLDEEFEISGCNAKTRMQKEKNAKEREISSIHRMRKAGADFDRIAAETGRGVAFVMDVLKIPDVAPSYEDLDRLKERREIRNADGFIEELERPSEVWRDTYPEPENEQEPLGHEYAPTPTPSQEPRESRVSSSGEVSKGHVPPAYESRSEEDEHPLFCDCLECSFPAMRYASPARHDYASLVT
jgi:hypothetical protein